MKTRKLQIELSEHTFAYLEMLAYGLAVERKDLPENIKEWKGFDKSKDDFAPAVRKLIVEMCNSVSTGVSRPASWEREVVGSLTGWDGTFNRGMLAECIKAEVGQENDK